MLKTVNMFMKLNKVLVALVTVKRRFFAHWCYL
jgi:hypothetical protein